ncbi:MAG: T9SS type A sorting domain-containing protein [Sphingobacteriales bacterium JAD_PAG50586_3]|nr:MAG: T9SS type A sorting domain-containing protein [Sphingobacteriales bacterium JAD_PAG50586_3]
MFDGVYRNYRLYVPAVYNSNTPVPLILNLHGYTSNATEQQFYSYFDPIADTANFLLVMPQGTRDNQNQTFWNAFGGPGPNDVGFLSALIDTINAGYNVNLNRVYSTGMSNGGFMSYKLACELSNRIAAIASVTGTMVTTQFNNCTPTHPVPVMEIHGTADGTVPYNGGSGFAAIPNVLSYWVNNNNCNPVADSSDVPNSNTTDGCTAKRYVWSGGDNGATVEHYKVIGGGHTWPGALFNIGVTNQDFNASQEIWRFFNQYTLSGLTDIKQTAEATAGFTIYPNPTNTDFTVTFADNSKRTVTVVNAMGQVVQQLATADKQLLLPLSTTGLYFVTVQQGANVWSKKVVKY